ncbi:MAG: hypothetical protein LAQ69_20855 [Acidobacteriia bacterium]|nr:hypothetical protein [Terriglobia bacterium]
MSGVSLLSPVLNGIQNVNFVNGRVLTAEDLTAERRANLQRQRQLGTCVGEGVSHGLAVTVSSSSVPFGQQVVHITSGLALNRNGDVLQLASDTDVTLAGSAAAVPANAGLFAPCQPPETQLTNPGIYVLTILPASGFEGQVPVVQLNGAGVAQSCSSAFVAAGVQFRLQQLTLDSAGSALQASLFTLANQIQTQLANNASAASVAPALSQLRNGLAYACFGTDAVEQYAADPLNFLAGTTPFAQYGLLDQARGAGLLTNCEVPLALVYWTTAGIQFVDMWSARRRVTEGAVTGRFPLLEGDRRVSEAEAMFLQFEDHALSLLTGPVGPGSISADNYFLFLPAVGMVEITGDGIDAVTTKAPLTGFDLPTFFGAHASHDIATTNGNLLRDLFHDALYQEPIQLVDTGEIQLYLVWENLQAVNAGRSGRLAAVFASGALRYCGIARFGTAKWSLSRFAPRVI